MDTSLPSDSLRFGVSIPQAGPCASPSFGQEFCARAEELGFTALWAVDHLVAPITTDSLYPLGRTPTALADGEVAATLSPNYEMVATLAWISGLTSRVLLGTSVAVLTIRNALTVARQIATIDVLSGGRVIFGVGVGWLKEEAEVLDMPWANRGRRFEEAISLMRSLWSATDGPFEFRGEYFDVPPIDPEPRPIQRPIPIYVGGHSATALDRAGRLGDGWISASMSPSRLADHITTVRRAAEESGRDPMSVQIVSRMSSRISRDQLLSEVDAYRKVGVAHLQIPVETDDPVLALEHLEVLGVALRNEGLES